MNNRTKIMSHKYQTQIVLIVYLIISLSIATWATDENMVDHKKWPLKLKNYKILFKEDKVNQTNRGSYSKKIGKLTLNYKLSF